MYARLMINDNKDLFGLFGHDPEGHAASNSKLDEKIMNLQIGIRARKNHEERMKYLQAQGVTMGDIGNTIGIVGDGIEVVGYFVAILPTGQAVGAAIILTGKLISYGGAGLEIIIDLQNGKEGAAATKVGIMFVSGAANKLISRSLKIGTPARALYEAGSKTGENLIEKKIDGQK